MDAPGTVMDALVNVPPNALLYAQAALDSVAAHAPVDVMDAQDSAIQTAQGPVPGVVLPYAVYVPLAAQALVRAAVGVLRHADLTARRTVVQIVLVDAIPTALAHVLRPVL